MTDMATHQTNQPPHKFNGITPYLTVRGASDWFIVTCESTTPMFGHTWSIGAPVKK